MGTLDLGSEDMDFVLTPRPKAVAFLSLASTVRVTGPLSTPRVSMDPLDIAQSKVWQVLDVIDPVGLSLNIPGLLPGGKSGIGGKNRPKGSGEENPCLTALDVTKQESLSTKKVVRGVFDMIKGLWKDFLDLVRGHSNED